MSLSGKSIIPVLFILFSIVKGYSQCNDELGNACISKLGTGFNFLKNYKIEKNDKKYAEFSYVLTKGTQYMIRICTPTMEVEGLSLQLFDSQRNLIASNKVNDQIVAAIAFNCQATGIYYMRFTHEAASGKCWTGTLGFKRQ